MFGRPFGLRHLRDGIKIIPNYIDYTQEKSLVQLNAVVQPLSPLNDGKEKTKKHMREKKMSAIAKNTHFIKVIIWIGIFFNPTYSFAQSIGVTGQFGAIFLTAMRDEEFANRWGTEGIVHSGGIILQHSFLLSDISERFKDSLIPYEVGIEFTRTETWKATTANISVLGDIPVTTKSELLSLMVSTRIFNDEKYYLMFGVGKTWLRGYFSVGVISGDITSEDWAFQVGVGKDSTKDLRFEVKYLHGGRNGNSGIIFGLGGKLNLF